MATLRTGIPMYRDGRGGRIALAFALNDSPGGPDQLTSIKSN
jgi:hypothetical protein